MKRHAFYAAVATLASLPALALASDHLDAPMLTGRGGADVNDLYAFRSPANPDNTVLILTVNPFAGSASPTTFDPSVRYDFAIDNTGDASEDITYSASFGAAGPGGVQSFTLSRGSSVVATGTTDADLAVSGGGTVRAGLYDDPFFFDLNGFRNGFAFTGSDAFAGANVSAIILEVPSTSFGGANLGVWARTESGGVQVDRVGRPAINTALIPSGRKDEFNQASPAGDFAAFGADVMATITALSSASNASGLTPVLLPDVLTIDTSAASGFLNGRLLADDVIDAELNLLSAGAVTGDGVNANDAPFLGVFPYLAAPNVLVPEPASAALGLAAAWLVAGARRRR